MTVSRHIPIKYLKKPDVDSQLKYNYKDNIIICYTYCVCR